MAAMRQLVDSPEGTRYVVTAHRASAALLSGRAFLPGGRDGDDAWVVRVEGGGRRRTFDAGSGEIAERLMVLLGEELELGLLEL